MTTTAMSVPNHAGRSAMTRNAARGSTKPVLATFMGVEGAIPLLEPIPAYRFPEVAVAALARDRENPRAVETGADG